MLINLPTELILNIFSFCNDDGETLDALYKACRDFNNLCLDQKISYDQTRFIDANSKSGLIVCSSIDRILFRMEVSLANFENEILKLLNRCKNLESLLFHGPMGYTYEAIRPNAKSTALRMFLSPNYCDDSEL